MIRDKIVFSANGKLQELLLREEKLDLEKCIQICRAYEQSNKHVKNSVIMSLHLYKKLKRNRNQQTVQQKNLELKLSNNTSMNKHREKKQRN